MYPCDVHTRTTLSVHWHYVLCNACSTQNPLAHWQALHPKGQSPEARIETSAAARDSARGRSAHEGVARVNDEVALPAGTWWEVPVRRTTVVGRTRS